jgi:hypothetical protein
VGFRLIVEAVRDEFRRTCLLLDVGEVELVDLMEIGSTVLFRARVLNRDQRTRLLENARNLKHSDEYMSVYIQRDQHSGRGRR